MHAQSSTLSPRRRAADTQAAVRREVDAGAELILHVGDISYANGRPEVRAQRSRSWFCPCALLSRAPVPARGMAAVG